MEDVQYLKRWWDENKKGIIQSSQNESRDRLLREIGILKDKQERGIQETLEKEEQEVAVLKERLNKVRSNAGKQTTDTGDPGAKRCEDLQTEANNYMFARSKVVSSLLNGEGVLSDEQSQQLADTLKDAYKFVEEALKTQFDNIKKELKVDSANARFVSEYDKEFYEMRNLLSYRLLPILCQNFCDKKPNVCITNHAHACVRLSWVALTNDSDNPCYFEWGNNRQDWENLFLKINSNKIDENFNKKAYKVIAPAIVSKSNDSVMVKGKVQKKSADAKDSPRRNSVANESMEAQTGEGNDKDDRNRTSQADTNKNPHKEKPQKQMAATGVTTEHNIALKINGEKRMDDTEKGSSSQGNKKQRGFVTTINVTTQF